HAEGYGQISWATYNTVNAEGAISAPLSDWLAVRVSGMLQRRSPWVDNLFTGEKDASEGYTQAAIRGQVLFRPNDRLSVLAGVHHMHLDGTPRLFRANAIEFGTNHFVAGFE